LARPVTHRSRRIAAWLFVPVAEAVRRAAGSLRRNHVTQVATAVVAAGAITIGVISANDRPETAAPAREQALLRPAPTTPPTSATVVPATPAAATPAPATTAPNPCPAPVPLGQVDPSTALGCPIAPTAVTVTDVPFDEGFWVQTDTGTTVFVQLIGEGESAISIEPGTPLTVAGTLRTRPVDGPITSDPRLATVAYILEVPFDAVTPN